MTREGRPYLALEYVAGRSIDKYCAEERLDLRARVRLFLQVVQTGLTFMGYEQDVQNIAQGIILVGAMLLSRLGASRR